MATSSLIRRFQTARNSLRSSNPQRLFRRPRLEPLEERCVLSLPTLAPIVDITVDSGAPIHIALDGFDLDGDALSFSVSSTNSSLEMFIPEGNRSLNISVDGFGDMVFELFEQRAPNTTARIAELVEDGFYDGIIFHRVIENFMIQGGDPSGTGSGGSGVEFDDEFHADLRHSGVGVLSMAKSGDDTNDSQFFITAGPTRYLDFNHSIFGQLVDGEDVRQAIAAVGVDGSDKPTADVTMDSVTVFFDQENGVLMLSAPEGTTGEADVTVTVDDGNGGTAQQTFHVTIVEDAINDNPFLLPINELHTTAGQPITFDLSALDVEGDAVVFNGYATADAADLLLEINDDTGEAVLTPGDGVAGVFSIFIGVRSTDGSWDDSVADFQSIPVLIDPAAPSNIELSSSSDTGISDDDGITNLNNADTNSKMSFLVSGVVDGAEVTLFADGVAIGQATAVGDFAVVLTEGDFELSDGVHSITASQILRDQVIDIGNSEGEVDLGSDLSAEFEIRIDTEDPQFISTPIEEALEGASYSYDAQSDAEDDGPAEYQLLVAPAGMILDSSTGQITWTPQSDQGSSQSVTLQVRDTAGNLAQQQFDIQIVAAPELEPIADPQVAEGSSLSLTAVVADNDGNIVFSLGAGAPAGAAIDSTSGLITWTTDETDGPDQFLFQVHATNTLGAVATEAFWVTVTEVNTPPVLQPIDDVTANEGQQIAFSVAVSDADLPANTFSYSLLGGAPAGASIHPTTGRFTFRPGETHGGGEFQITVRVTDSGGASDQQSFTVHVVEVDLPPVISAISSRMVAPGDRLSLWVRAADPDIPANGVFYQLEPGAPAGATIDSATGLLTWNVDPDHATANVELTVRATEITPNGPGLSSLAVINVFVFDFRLAALAEITNAERADRGSEANSPLSPVSLVDATLLELDASNTPDDGALQLRVTPAPQPASHLLGSNPFGSLFGPIFSTVYGNFRIEPLSGEEPGSSEPSETSERSETPTDYHAEVPPPIEDSPQGEASPQQVVEVPDDVLQAIARSEVMLAKLAEEADRAPSEDNPEPADG